MSQWRLGAVALLLVVGGALGCQEQKVGAIVTGKVTYRGAPVAKATISFIQRSGGVATSKIEADGSYSLRDRENSAVIPTGSYDVVILAGVDTLDMSGGDELAGKMEVLVPPSVLRLATTPLHYDLVEGPNVIDVNLDDLPRKK